MFTSAPQATRGFTAQDTLISGHKKMAGVLLFQITIAATPLHLVPAQTHT